MHSCLWVSLLTSCCPPTWEISARMSARYCRPWPRASMAARNSFLSWISRTTGQEEKVFRVPLPGWGSSPSPTQVLTFLETVWLRGWVLLPHGTSLPSWFLCVLPSGKDVLESKFLLLQVSCRAQSEGANGAPFMGCPHGRQAGMLQGPWAVARGLLLAQHLPWCSLGLSKLIGTEGRQHRLWGCTARLWKLGAWWPKPCHGEHSWSVGAAQAWGFQQIWEGAGPEEARWAGAGMVPAAGLGPGGDPSGDCAVTRTWL